ncbi:hypothetical protein ETAA8_03600 [Anatilimnocola aggregata]|uniref:HEAT repeat domain-containing protein n=1 Tax=Anatilimnocola aggregata TaxID=2528021 RepID=A0A517Y523_9BACT|nr:hypothetical protein [Anatilimnocola aggregata]QDU25296.1 hypothetical protein ETAA8_03600 [Anatilimnocola aggregata]
MSHFNQDEPSIDWPALAREVGALTEKGESGGSDLARRAIVQLLGEEALRAAVDHYVAGKPGSELARSVLWQLQPAVAMERCVELARSQGDSDTRSIAVELLRVVADARGLAWAAEFMQDADLGVQVWAAGIVDQLLWSRQAEPAACAELLSTMEAHSNPEVRHRAEFIRTYLAERAAAE